LHVGFSSGLVLKLLKSEPSSSGFAKAKFRGK